MELDEAFRILELKPGAGVKEAVEAREDQLALWDPDRLAHHPRLRSRAPARLERIRLAYEAVMRHLDEAGQRPPRGAALPPGRGVAAAESRSSLFEEVFAPSAGPRRVSGPVPVLAAAAAITIVILALVWFWSSQSESVPDQPAVEPSAVETPKTSETTTEETNPGSDPESPIAARGSPEAVVAAPGAARFETPAPRLPPPRRDGPKLVRRPADSTAVGVETRSTEEADRQGEWLYRRLLAESPAARGLVEGDLPGWRIQSWELVQSKPPEYWIDLTGRREDGSTTHFVWSINLESGRVEPWNEAARALQEERSR